MKVFNFFTFTLLLIIGLNLLSWLFYGRNSILLKSSRFFDESCYATNADTLHIYSALSDDIEYYLGFSSFGDFPKSFKEKLIDSLEHRSNSIVIYKDQIIDNPFPDKFGEINFWTSIDRRYPFYSSVSAGEAAIGFGADYSQTWIWLFKWYPIQRTLQSGCS